MYDTSSLVTYLGFGVIATAIGWFAYKVYIWPYYLSPLRNIPGPPTESLIYGSVKRLFIEDAGEPYYRWVKEYGSFVKYHGLLNQPTIIVTDPKSLQEILSANGYDFAKFIRTRGDMTYIIGLGLSQVEGDVHKKQRKMMNPAFAHKFIKNMVPTFIRVGLTLKGLINDKINNGESRMILNCISKATLDTIGLVGFDYKFNSLTSPCELVKAYAALMEGITSSLSLVLSNMALYVPLIRNIPIDLNKKYKYTRRVLERESRRMVKEKYDDDKNNRLGENDLLSILININKTLPVEEKMTDEELRHQILNTLLAGHMTTSTTISWALHLLAQHPHDQDLLREELVKAFPDKSNFNPTFDEINSLEYLNCVLKETLRVHSPVVVLNRSNVKDMFLGEHFIPKDTMIEVPISTLHRLPSIWGPTADDFDPKRWLNPSLIKNVTNYNYLPFGAGVRACIGSKIALNESKVLLGMLVRNFVFQPVEGLHIKRSTGLLNKPDPHLELNVSRVEV